MTHSAARSIAAAVARPVETVERQTRPRRCRRDRDNAGSRTGRPSRRAASRAAPPPSRRRHRAPAFRRASRARARSPVSSAPVADFHQRVAGERGVPDRRQAGLAIAALAVEHEQLADSDAGRRAIGMVGRIAEAIEHHQRVGHRRKNAAEPVLAVEPLGDKGDRLVDRAPPRHRPGTTARPTRSSRSSTRKRHRRAATRSAPVIQSRTASGGSTNNSPIVMPRGLRARGRSAISTKQRHQHGARPVRDLGDMKRRPAAAAA